MEIVLDGSQKYLANRNVQDNIFFLFQKGKEKQYEHEHLTN